MSKIKKESEKIGEFQKGEVIFKKEIESYSEDDWKKLEKRTNDTFLYKLFTIITIFVLGLGFFFKVFFEFFHVLSIFGALFLVIISSFKTRDARNKIKEIFKLECESERKIIPENFFVKNGFGLSPLYINREDVVKEIGKDLWSKPEELLIYRSKKGTLKAMTYLVGSLAFFCVLRTFLAGEFFLISLPIIIYVAYRFHVKPEIYSIRLEAILEYEKLTNEKNNSRKNKR